MRHIGACAGQPGRCLLDTNVIQHTEARLTKAANLALAPAAAGPSRRAGRAPVTSRHALDEAGFEVIEQRQASLLFGWSVLITGEVDRVADFEKGFPIPAPA